ncbi:hypothetical protein ACI3L3_07880 [Desulfobaculum sp. SPO524]|uniref:hypothetical protein n=1 Tax=Desulfobaculum sp. SPO524 TaxID=3378071 RepID=UPI003854655A
MTTPAASGPQPPEQPQSVPAPRQLPRQRPGITPDAPPTTERVRRVPEAGTGRIVDNRV